MPATYRPAAASARQIIAALLLLALTACSGATLGGARTPQGSPQATQGVQKNTPQATQKAPEAEIDHVATQSAILDALAVSQGQTAALQQQLADESIEQDRIALQIEEAKRETEKYKAAQGANAAQLADAQAREALAIARQKEADALKAKYNADYAQALADIQDGRTRQVLTLFVGALGIAAFFLVARVLSRPRQVQAEPVEEPEQEESKHPELETLPAVAPEELPDTPPGDPAKFSSYAEYALADGLLGVNSVERLTPYTRPEYIPILAWMKGKDYMAYDAVRRGVVLNDPGREKCRSWLMSNPPSLVYVPKPEISRHSHVKHAHDAAGEGSGL